MPSLYRTLFFTACTLFAVLASGPVTPVSATASPAALPMPLQAADFSGHVAPIAYATRHKAMKRSHPGNHTAHATFKSSPKHKTKHSSNNVPTVEDSVQSVSQRTVRRGSYTDLDSLLGGLGSQRDDVVSNSQDLKRLAAQSSSVNGNNGEFQQNAASGFSTFYTSAQGFQGLFGQLAAEKGLANYDKTDELETVLKDVVNAHKDALTATNVIIFNVPILGPVLGPIVYDIKCLIDDLLNITENLTDGLLNALVPAMGDLLGRATDMTCSSQLKVLGLCLG